MRCLIIQSPLVKTEISEMTTRSSTRIKAVVHQQEKSRQFHPVNEILSRGRECRDDGDWSSKEGHPHNNARTPRAVLQPLLDHNNKIIYEQQGQGRGHGQGRSPRFLVSRKSPIIASKSNPKPKPKPKSPAKQRVRVLFELESGSGSGSEGTNDSVLDEFERNAKEFHKIKRHAMGSVFTKLVMKKLIMDDSNYLKQPDAASSSASASATASSSADSGFYEEKSRSN